MNLLALRAVKRPLVQAVQNVQVVQRSAESWTILQQTGVFDSVARETILLSKARQEKAGSTKGTDDPALEQET
jgi:hypothetical protein